MKKRVLVCRWEGETEWKEWKDSELNLEEWDIDIVYKTEYKVIEVEESNNG